ASGHLTGKLVREGGPLGPGGKQPGERAMSGTVTVTSAGHHPVTVTVGSSGTFSVPLPPGRYHVSGRSFHVMEIDGGSSREPPWSWRWTRGSRSSAAWTETGWPTRSGWKAICRISPVT